MVTGIFALWLFVLAASIYLGWRYKGTPNAKEAYAVATRYSLWYGLIGGVLLCGTFISNMMTDGVGQIIMFWAMILFGWPLLTAFVCLFTLPLIYLYLFASLRLSEAEENDAKDEPPEPEVEEVEAETESSSRGPAITISILCLLVGIVIFILIAIPKFQDLIPGNRNKRNINKGNLGAIRSALYIYHGDHDETYPKMPQDLTIDGNYMSALPKIQDTPHAPTDAVAPYSTRSSRDTGSWGYVNNPSDPDWGSIYIDCTHTDLKGVVWASY